MRNAVYNRKNCSAKCYAGHKHELQARYDLFDTFPKQILSCKKIYVQNAVKIYEQNLCGFGAFGTNTTKSKHLLLILYTKGEIKANKNQKKKL